MKFTKEQCLEQIQAVLGKTKLTSDRSILENLDTLIPLIANDEMELKDFVDKVSPSFKTMESNLKHEQSIFAKDFIEKNKPKQVDVEKPKEANAPSKTDDNSAVMASMVESINLLKNELVALKANESKKNAYSEARSKFNSFNPNPSKSALIDLAFKYASQVSGDDVSADALAMSAKSHYDELLLASGGSDGYVPTKAVVESNTNQMWSSIKEGLKKSGHLPESKTN